MNEHEQSGLLNSLSAKIQNGWQDTGEDRRMFFRGMYHLQLGDIEEACRVFRRASRRCEAPFDLMSRMAHGRCEARRGRQGAALRIFRTVASSDDTPDRLRRMAWMEVADLAEQRDDQQLYKRARDEMKLYRQASKSADE